MSEGLSALNELRHRILHLMMAGWQTMDYGKSEGMFRLNELAEHFNLPLDQMREEMTLLEDLGYVENVHSFGYEQTKAQKGILDSDEMADVLEHPVYFIAEQGKRMVVADIAAEESEESRSSAG